MESRRISQITVLPAPDKGSYPSLLALCADGSLWWSIFTPDGVQKWQAYAPIPTTA